ncbi:uncharacterized protein LOC129611669 isoform X2 [Condylostylus longicornis]|uniref:uncharacterized protein LOC129611669 isoform X2 n=1 Tax=Condylostylus longicornis TaxID=2530218 RepID=UPI00244E4590|nr:uncharacterized protein LOC129611669 isoform X2 [Condylostylus longicornis]
MTASPSDDKTCRMCGHADRSNLNLFHPRQIYKKILALYPIVLYKSDPLPKNICLKCYASTLKRYEEYVRVGKIQTRWINNVRNNQPNNPYIKILDKIEETNKNLIEQLRKLGDDAVDESFSITKHSRNQFPEDIFNSTSSFNYNNQSHPFNRDNRMQKFNNQANRILLSHLRGENQNKNLNFKSQNGFPHEPNISNIQNFPRNKCRYCFKVLPNQKYLAFHQLKYHIGLAVFKSFTKKALPKKLRCGQAIKINNKACLRCNNCGKCFDSYDSILNHWQNKRCEFYCLICGKEYPNDPSPLKKHIKLEHFLEYTSYKDLIRKSRKLNQIKKQPLSPSLSQYNEIDEEASKLNEPNERDNEENPLELDFEKESSFEFINVAEKPKIPVLKLLRKTNSEKNEFDIKVENMYRSPSYPRSPDSPSSNGLNDSIGKPFTLRVKDLSELQCKPKEEEEDEEYISLNDFKLNTLNLDSEDPCSTKENFLEECQDI